MSWACVAEDLPIACRYCRHEVQPGEMFWRWATDPLRAVGMALCMKCGLWAQGRSRFKGRAKEEVRSG